MIIKCKKCKYEWDTNSKLWTVSCPSCGTKNLTDAGNKSKEKFANERRI